MTVTVVKAGGIVTVEKSATVNIETFSDCDFMQTFSFVTNSDTPEPISLEGASLQMMVRKRASAAGVLAEMSTANGRITVDFEVVGQFTVRIPFSELSVLSEGDYVHSLIATWTVTGILEAIWRGVMIHSVGPTRGKVSASAITGTQSTPGPVQGTA